MPISKKRKKKKSNKVTPLSSKKKKIKDPQTPEEIVHFFKDELVVQLLKHAQSPIPDYLGFQDWYSSFIEKYIKPHQKITTGATNPMVDNLMLAITFIVEKKLDHYRENPETCVEYNIMKLLLSVTTSNRNSIHAKEEITDVETALINDVESFYDEL